MTSGSPNKAASNELFPLPTGPTTIVRPPLAGSKRSTVSTRLSFKLSPSFRFTSTSKDSLTTSGSGGPSPFPLLLPFPLPLPLLGSNLPKQELRHPGLPLPLPFAPRSWCARGYPNSTSTNLISFVVAPSSLRSGNSSAASIFCSRPIVTAILISSDRPKGRNAMGKRIMLSRATAVNTVEGVRTLPTAAYIPKVTTARITGAVRITTTTKDKYNA
mmetsp:Transcript_144179/g.401700  ORF Transcript_144179/g.401700 Transcript_144179/m.401700 type:complete len:216 (-) Transcript_144179:1071-1718(-)